MQGRWNFIKDRLAQGIGSLTPMLVRVAPRVATVGKNLTPQPTNTSQLLRTVPGNVRIAALPPITYYDAVTANTPIGTPRLKPSVVTPQLKPVPSTFIRRFSSAARVADPVKGRNIVKEFNDKAKAAGTNKALVDSLGSSDHGLTVHDVAQGCKLLNQNMLCKCRTNEQGTNNGQGLTESEDDYQTRMRDTGKAYSDIISKNPTIGIMTLQEAPLPGTDAYKAFINELPANWRPQEPAHKIKRAGKQSCTLTLFDRNRIKSFQAINLPPAEDAATNKALEAQKNCYQLFKITDNSGKELIVMNVHFDWHNPLVGEETKKDASVDWSKPNQYSDGTEQAALVSKHYLKWLEKTNQKGGMVGDTNYLGCQVHIGKALYAAPANSDVRGYEIGSGFQPFDIGITQQIDIFTRNYPPRTIEFGIKKAEQKDPHDFAQGSKNNNAGAGVTSNRH